MKVDEVIKGRLDELIITGQQVLGTKQSPGPNVLGDSRVDRQMAHQWATSVQNLLARAFGQESEHYRNFTAQVNGLLTLWKQDSVALPSLCAHRKAAGITGK